MWEENNRQQKTETVYYLKFKTIEQSSNNIWFTKAIL